MYVRLSQYFSFLDLKEIVTTFLLFIAKLPFFGFNNPFQVISKKQLQIGISTQQNVSVDACGGA